MPMTAHPHIRLDNQGVAWIDGTNVKVIEVVLDRLAYGWSPEEIHFQHAADLSLAQIPLRPSPITTTTKHGWRQRSPAKNTRSAGCAARPGSRPSWLV